MKKVAVIQSSYIPWKGYFDIIHDVDEFVFYDDVQYTKRDWRSRNVIKTASGSKWITIPVGNQTKKNICDVKIPSSEWQKQHFCLISQNYSKSNYYKDYKEFLEYVYLESTWDSLSELNQFFIKKISKEYLGIKTIFSDSRDYMAAGIKHEKMLNLLKALNAECYISGPAAKNYIIEDDYKSSGIELIWKDYSGYPEYNQLFPPFEHGVTILDLLMNTGKDAPYYIWGWRQNNKVN